MACAPQLVQPAAGAACAANASFGCWSDSSVWVAPPCAAHFHCGPARTLVFCAAATRTAVCSCAKKKGRAVRLPHPRGMEELARLHLAPWTKRGIFSSDLSRTEAFLSPLNRYAAPGAWRAKLLGGSLWIKPIHARQQWIERTSVLRLLLLALPSPPHERLPDVDLLYVHSDFDISPPRGYNCTLRRPGRCEDTRLPLFINANMPERATLPFPDFSWVGWGVRTEPWCSLLPQMDAASRATPWVERIDLGYFSGGLRSGLFRNALREISTSPLAAGVLRVRDVAPSFYTLSKASQLGAEKPEPMSAACGYRYLLSVPGYGYSNRLKALLACGSVVIHVEPRSGPQEFYRPLLVNGKHLVVVRSVHQIIPAILELRRNSTRAERIGKLKRAECERSLQLFRLPSGRAGRELVLTQLSMGHVIEYVRRLLRAYANASRSPVRLEPGYTAISSAADMGRLMLSGAQGKQHARKAPPLKQRSQDELLALSLGTSQCCKGFDCPIDPASASICERINGEVNFVKDQRRNKMRKPGYSEPAVGWNDEDEKAEVTKYGVAHLEGAKTKQIPAATMKRPTNQYSIYPYGSMACASVDVICI
ncbi:MAG: hypothetical protein SGPRY_001126 [Prymnesium sp.]